MSCRNCRYSYTDTQEKFGGFYTKTVYVCGLMGKVVDEYGSCKEYEEERNETNMGYKGSNLGGGCFLTSACVEYLGKEDNCEELTALRNFRDEYMKKTKEGKELVDEYYKVAPQIVKFIDSSSQKGDYYQYIYGVICECMELLKNGNNEAVLEAYKNMVVRLKEECHL